ncbi:CoB--CoM heterodisulfide reductase iron-sulfur subunit B family protein [Desulfohalovibrio reitneri]|uniref:CoB--CoM heterodisulfide reductase iron-sulfur subunit B family protein n=1 Tax=Desulfohalovibrio reitneri TaxID=1307759 RepID=UPI000AB5489E|nr:CoB--CoM heterodisulfide reductase iron-sulfur subunit B family protein [Desulfohalovibrio reitneri]
MTMTYAYYPGCSLKESAVEYDASTRAVLEVLGAELKDIPDWTCCGASAADAVSESMGLLLPARNLALAARDEPGWDVLVPCSACYLNLRRVAEKTRHDHAMLDRINSGLAGEGLELSGEVRVRHLLDVLSSDLLEAFTGRVKRSLNGLRVAPYYGCQALRPYAVFDDPEHPVSMEPLVEAMGGEVVPWGAGNRCCGASLLVTHRQAALDRVDEILAQAGDADVVVTVCPLCQMNLESARRSALAGREKPLSILYLPQLMGLALDLAPRRLLLDKNMRAEPGLAAGRLPEPAQKDEPVVNA